MNSLKQNGDLHSYYQKIYQLQDYILEVIFAKTDEHSFYLTGGTALNRFYYPVRYSEDLDFFTNENNLFRDDLRFLMEEFNKKSLPFIREIDSRDFVRLIFFPEEGKVKVDFVNDRVFRYGKPQYFNHKRIDNVWNILANKICAVISRDDPKDVADILTIATNEEFVWHEIISIAQKKENFERAFLIERLKSFPLELFDTCLFINEETGEKYKKLLPILIEDLIQGEENSLKKFND